jgi:hypothetical protein
VDRLSVLREGAGDRAHARAPGLGALAAQVTSIVQELSDGRAL